MAKQDDEKHCAETENNPETFAPGAIIDGRYKILSLIGQGGMGSVYLCEQIYLGRRFALKVLDSEKISSVGIRRFQQEAKLIVSIEHENIVAVHDFGVIADRYPFFTMDYLEGPSLAEVMSNKGTLTIAEALPIVKSICAGLSHAHSQGIVHRDIKPSNIMIVDDANQSDKKRICIVDFGIAKLSSTDASEEQSLTKTGEVFGSPPYMSPEQCAGKVVDSRADIYSLGCVLFEMLTGTPPFLGATAFTTMVQHYTREKPPTLKEATLGQEFPQEMERTVAKMLSKEVENRYQNLASVVQDLSDINEGVQPHNVVLAEGVQQQRNVRTNKPSIFGFLTIAIAAAILLSYFALQSNRSQHTDQPKSSFNAPTQTTEPTARQTDSANDAGRLPALDTVPFPANLEMLNRLAQPISSKELDTILEHPDSDNKLDLKMRILTSDDLEKIGRTKWVENFSAKGAQIRNQALSNLTKLRLWNINLSGSNFNDPGAGAISKLKTLRVLNVGNTEISDAGVKEICTMKILKALELDGTEITARSMHALSSCEHLKWLSLRSVKSLHEEDMKPLQFAKLQFINIEDTAIGDKSISSMVCMPDLETICIGQSKISIKGAEALLKMKSLKNIYYTANENLETEKWKQLQFQYPKINFHRGMHAGDTYN